MGNKYWVFLNNGVAGPYDLEQLIRVRGFSRQTLVCADDGSGRQTSWISPADIPELTHIFKAVDEQLLAPTSAPPVRSAPKPIPMRPAPRPLASAAVRVPAKKSYRVWWIALSVLLLGAAAFFGSQYLRRRAEAGERAAAQVLVENAPLPASSLYGTLRQYLQEKGIRPRWEFEHIQDDLNHVSLSWSDRAGASVYAFEVNAQAQTVRGLNTAAIKLLSEGFPAPASRAAKAAPKKSPADLFAPALDRYREALEGGDFQSVWSLYSARKKSEMAKGGMSRDGFIRLQNLTYHVDSAVKQSVLKTKDESDSERLVLLKQSQAGRPDIFIKQLWIFQDDDWVLDDEEKHTATTPAPEAAAESAPAPAKPAPAALPGMSN